jgi:putative glycosyltransferase (TIGR04372 family)
MREITETALYLGGRSVLVVRPTISLGHLNLEIMLAAATARRNGSWLYLCEPQSAVNRTPFDLEIPNVRRLPSVAMLDRFLIWVDLPRKAARHQPARQRNRMRRQLSLPLDSWLLEREYRARVRIAVWRLWLSERRLARRLRAIRKQDKQKKLLRQTSFPPATFGSETVKQLKDQHQRVAKLLKEYVKHFVKTCARNPLDCRTFWSWPVYKVKLQRRRRLAKLTVEGQGRTYFKRRLIAETVPCRFRDADRDRLEALLCELGLRPGAKLVTLHVRESGFKRGLETHDRDKVRGRERDKIRDDSTRNATIENCFPAIRHLTDAGYTIVRIGDSSMTPLSLPSVVDIATLPGRDPALDYYCVSRSEFFIACDSGPWTMSWMMGTPVLTLNARHAVPVWPINKRDLVVPKYVREIATGRFLTLRQTCERPHNDHFRVTAFYDYVELTPQDILTAVQEMQERVEAARVPNATLLQAKYHNMYLEMMTSEMVNQYFLKWGPDDGFLGNGAIAQFVVERDAAIGWQPLTEATSKTHEHELAVQNTSAARYSNNRRIYED